MTGWSEKDDNELLAHIQKGNHHAFATLVRRHTKRFYSVAYRFTRNRDEAEDIVQSVFLRLWERPDMWSKTRGSKFTTWFYRVVVNLCLDWQRKKRPLLLTEDFQILDERESYEESIIRLEQQRTLEMAIAALPKRQRTALNLCFYEGMSNKEASEVMGINLKALQSLLMRAKANIKEKMKAYL